MKKSTKKARVAKTRVASAPHHINWNDGTLEVMPASGVSAEPFLCCAECEGQFWLGQSMVAVSHCELVHDDCFAAYAKRWGLNVGDAFGVAAL